MKKSVLISIQPYWVFLIIAKSMGWDIKQEKTVEVRKNFPKDENWDKTVKIYCSKDAKSFNRIPKEYQPAMKQFLGRVVGEFVCDDILTAKFGDYVGTFSEDAHLTAFELIKYSNGKPLYGWSISSLIVYKNPKSLGCFYKAGLPEMEDVTEKLCEYCHATDYGNKKQVHTPNGVQSCEGRYCEDAYFAYLEDNYALKTPPQSWCYTEEVA